MLIQFHFVQILFFFCLTIVVIVIVITILLFSFPYPNDATRQRDSRIDNKEKKREDIQHKIAIKTTKNSIFSLVKCKNIISNKASTDHGAIPFSSYAVVFQFLRVESGKSVGPNETDRPSLSY